MKKQLAKPENWQDFESLCKVLWGEIWNCPEIKKNGRVGQEQHGVDVYGTPEGETRYFGIQCKGKDDYTKSKLTQDEIDKEILKARSFKPILKKFYFATSANKDAKIEQYIRIKDEESRKNKKFEIHVFSWEDIVDLIYENRNTYNWYVNNIGFKSKHDVKITFHDDSTHLNYNPILVKNTIKYQLKDTSESWSQRLPHISADYNQGEHLERLFEPQPIRYYMYDNQTINKSSCVFSIIIENSGNIPLEHFKMYLSFKASGIVVDVVFKQQKFLDTHPYSYNTFMYQDSNDCVFEPKEKILVQTDVISTDKICLRPTIEESQDVIVEYNFVAKDFQQKGELSLRLENEINEKETIEDSVIDQENDIRLENCIE